MSFHYYGLIASLPFLSDDFNLNRLSISGRVLRSRLRGLSQSDQEQLGAIIDFHEQLYSITSYSDEQVVRMIEAVRQQLVYPQLQHLFETDVNIMILVSALRQRLANKEPILPRGEVAIHIRRNWQQPDFGLAGRFPWLPEVREYLEQGQVLELERRVDRVRWQYFVDLVQMDPFTLEAVAAYIGKWDILWRWSQVNETAGQERFDQLVAEVLQTA